MSAQSIDNQEFDAAWKAADGPRFDYTLNRGLLVLYALLLGGFWLFFGLTVAARGGDLVLWVVGGLFALVSVFVVYNVIFWRHFKRLSGVVCEDDRIVWRNGRNVYAARWVEVDFDELGLTNVDLGARKYEHFLNIAGKKLYLFRPHVRLRELEEFMGYVLLSLQKHGRIAAEPSKKKKKKGGKNKS